MEKINYLKKLTKNYRKEIWTKFVHALTDFEMITENDKIAVCISGGKDSMILALCFMELQKHRQKNFSLEFITMDPGYKTKDLDKIKENAKILGIDLKIFKSDIFEIVKKHGENDPCYLCARMRRGHLYNYAKKLGCNKIALAHHQNDVNETILLNMFYNGAYKSMLPKLKSTNFSNMELIRPLYYVNEEDIVKYIKSCQLSFIDCACDSIKLKEGKRAEIKNLIKELKKTNKDIEKNIYKSSTNVLLNTVIGYQKDNQAFNFLDDY
mgnify:FL=1